ncbi:MAG: S-(hydroxymethyl)glutathione dehydrogenase / alcohol dehydrogenase [Chloroflexi bacterium]|jgi:S-(hydroxymethyl)glutathione dehydrogenase/alcohol dehydrogenase|nr:MAG: S-(hydroxymethyl)glutathione dehydrogenase / alcohol dehydrogenase [Chloroflexota bacterium]
MKAAVLNKVGAPMTLEDLRLSEPRAGEVQIRVVGCGVCHTDLHVIKGEVGFPTPAVLGHEVSGIVEEIGPGVEGLATGDPVVCSFIMPCGRCNYCFQGRDDLCVNFFDYNRLKGTLYDGTTRLARADGSDVWMYSMGGLAERAVVPAGGVFKFQSDIPLDRASIIGCSVFTAYGAIKNQAKVSAGESVAVFAIGGVGINVVQIAKAFGATDVIAVDIRDDKLEMAKRLGATEVINAATEDAPARIREITNGRGVDVAVEALGRPETILQAYQSVADGGRVVIVGISDAGTTVPIEITRTVRRGISIIGSYGARVRTDMPTVIRLVERGLVDINAAISKVYTLDDVNEAYDTLNKGQTVGRSIISFT